MTTVIRLVSFEFALIRMLVFRVIFERFANSIMAALAGFSSVFYSYYASRGIYAITPTAENYAHIQAMILFAFLYGETIMASWQYTTNRTGRMELIFNSTQPPLRILLAKCLASSTVTMATMIVIFVPPLAWLGLLGAYNATFWIAAGATLLVCCSVMAFNAVFEFKFKQIKALTSMLNLVLPFLAMRFGTHLPWSFGFIPYFNGAKFLNLEGNFTFTDVGWLYLTAMVTALVFVMFSQTIVRRIRSTASVYLE